LLCRSRSYVNTILYFKNVCQLEGSDHGGRDSAAELALAGTIDVQVSDTSCNRLTLGPAPSDARNYTPPKRTVNGFVQNHNMKALFRDKSATVLSSEVSIDVPLCRR